MGASGCMGTWAHMHGRLCKEHAVTLCHLMLLSPLVQERVKPLHVSAMNIIACTPEHLQQRLVHEPIDVLDMVIGFVGSLNLLLGLPWVHTLEDTEPPAWHHPQH